MAAATVHIGVAGWSYPDWKHVVHAPGADALTALARTVPLLEINSSFYRVPSVETVDRWVRRTAPHGTVFTAKVPESITHRGARDRDVAAEFCTAFEPLVESGRFRGLLAQFSFRFRASDPGCFDLLRWIRGELGSLGPLFLEVRDRSWRTESAQRRAIDCGFELVELDYPGAARGFAVPDYIAESAYLRMHGRNHDAWFDKDAGRDATYDYLYPPGEVDQLAKRVAELANTAQVVHAVANNHFRGQAVKLALELRARHEDRRVDVPQGLIDRYPDLANIARTAQRGLFDEG